MANGSIFCQMSLCALSWYVLNISQQIGILSDVSRQINLVFCLMSDCELFQYSVGCHIGCLTVNFHGILSDV
jgi:hypothetical protein